MQINNYRNNRKTIIVFSLILIISLIACSEIKDHDIAVNSSHLDYLYENIEIGGEDMAIIHIYSNYPEYQYIDDDDEGTACVDDAARAAIFYLDHHKKYKDQISLEKNKRLLKFIMYMQSENGYFYNFVWPDLSINKEFKTSVAEPNWWSWRALWALSESFSYYKNYDSEIASKIDESIEKIIKAIKADMPKNKTYENYEGFKLPAWLPSKFASDQASVLLLGLINYSLVKNDTVVSEYIDMLCQGILEMQIHDKSNPYYGAFLSWQNNWHAWGNAQSFALLRAYSVLGKKEYLDSALKELDNFYLELINKKYTNSLVFNNDNGKVITNEEKLFPQIAYNIRPMVYALLEAYSITKDQKYFISANKCAGWLAGDNRIGHNMYDPKTGIVFDGIESDTKLNKNSGAESTIEALLTILKVKTLDTPM